MADVPLIGEALPADDPVSVWLTTLSLAFGDMQIVHVYLVEGHDKLSKGMSEATLFYGYRLASAHYREAAKLCRLARARSQPEIRKFYASLPEEVRRHLEDALRAYDSFGNHMRSLRNGLFHYPYPDGYKPDGGGARPGQERWDALAAVIHAAREHPMTTRPGKLRDSRFNWADDLAAEIVASTVGGVDCFAKVVEASADSVTGLMRFINTAVDERMVRAKLGLPVDRPRTELQP
jgi:hypothetical protein